MQNYTLEFFIQDYLAKCMVNKAITQDVTDAFYAGAQTTFLMMLNSMQNKNLDLIRSIENSLEVFKASKQAEQIKTFN